MIKRIFSGILVVLAFGLAGLAGLAGFIWAQRAQLTYNDQGRYFDGEVVYHEQALLFYAVMTLACAMLALLVFAAGRWLGRKKAL
jgi:hypothetical protein